MRDQSSTLKAEYNFWMLALSSIGGALSIVSLVQRVFRIGLAPILQSLVDYYRALLRPVVEAARWVIEGIFGAIAAIIPWWLYTIPWRIVIWLWESLWYYVLFGWLLHWLYPSVYAWIIHAVQWLTNFSPETFRDLYLLSFILMIPLIRSLAVTDSRVTSDIERFTFVAVFTVPMSAIASYWLIGLLMPAWAMLVAVSGYEEDPDTEAATVHYLVSLGAMTAAAIAFFALNGIIN